MDKVTDSDSVDAGSIPARNARIPYRFILIKRRCRKEENDETKSKILL